MALHGPVDLLDEQERTAVAALLGRLAPSIHHTPLGDDGWAALSGGRGPAGSGFSAAWSTDETGEVRVYAQATRQPADDAWIAALVVDPAAAGSLVDVGSAVLARALRSAGARTHWWISDPSPAHLEVVARVGLHDHRTLHQMTRALPLGDVGDDLRGLPTRPFEAGRDEDALLDINRRAFASHPDQGNMTRAQLDERMAQDWFDPAGCLMTEVDGQLAGFCWMKLFHEYDPPLGEIHIIAVDPGFTGRKLGPRLAVAGLDHAAEQGAGEAVLFVEGSNDGARAMYDRLGFGVTRTDRAFSTLSAG